MIDLSYPKTIEEFVGRRQQSLARKFTLNPPKLLLLKGPTGVGKTSLVKYIVYEVLKGVQVESIVCTEKRGIDEVRKIINEKINTRSLLAPERVLILDELQGWTGPAQGAILSVLDDPPEHVRIYATTMSPEALDNALHDRLNPHGLWSPTIREQADWVMSTLKEHNIAIEGYGTGREIVPKLVANGLVTEARGSIRLLKQLVGQLIEGTYEVNLELEKEVASLVDVLIKGKAGNPYIVNGDPYRILVGLCNYAITILATNPPDHPSSIRATEILQDFGQGLPPHVPPNIGLAHLVAKSVQ